MIHSFLRSIGFSELKQNSELYGILEEVINHPDEQEAGKDEYGNELVRFSKFVSGDMGISVCGYFIGNDEFRMEYYYPYLRGSHVTTYEQIEIEKHAARESYAGICDEIKLGVTLIFYIENIIDTIRESKFSGKNLNVTNTVLSALGYSGKILLPVMKTQKQMVLEKQSTEKRMSLMQQAREGDRSAIEDLTLRDMDTYSNLSRRIAKKEDVLTIVESSFIPYGVESDQYVIIGEILYFYQVQNKISKENVWILNIMCNKMQFDVCINAKDLLGEPEVGRRFKGRVWLMGHLNFGY